MNKYSDISESARDVLMEIGNIGTGNAVTALSSMINHRIEIERPNVKIMKFGKYPPCWAVRRRSSWECSWSSQAI